MSELTIGRLAKQAGVNTETLRYYERQGLLQEPSRTASNYRMYPVDTVKQIRFIKQAQKLGFTLKEIKGLLSLRASPRVRCADVRERGEDKLRALDEKIRMLQTMRKALSEGLVKCRNHKSLTGCPLLQSLDAEQDQ